MKIQLKRSNVLDGAAAKAPTSAQMEYGELAVNYNNTDPSLFIKDSTDAIVKVSLDLISSALQPGDALPVDDPAFTGQLTGPNATLSGYVNTGGFPKNALSNGAGVYSEGTFYASRGSASANVYTAYLTGNTTPTINLTAGGDGAFTGKITSGATVIGDSSTTLVTKGYVMPLDLDTLPELT